MRYVLVLVLLASVVTAFILADQFPGFLAHYPRLQEANWTVRSWLGMASPDSSPLSERNLKETEQILRKELPATQEVIEQDLREYRD
jgi:hypothetical protein